MTSAKHGGCDGGVRGALLSPPDPSLGAWQRLGRAILPWDGMNDVDGVCSDVLLRAARNNIRCLWRAMGCGLWYAMFLTRVSGWEQGVCPFLTLVRRQRIWVMLAEGGEVGSPVSKLKRPVY